MQLIAAAEHMQQFDRTAIRTFGVSGMLLMENAGRAFVDELERAYGLLASRTAVIVSGKGNNGGDGFVIARHLLNRGVRVQVVLLCKKTDVKGDARTNLNILLKLLHARRDAGSLREISSAQPLRQFAQADIIVDAIFGTGFSGAVRGLQRNAIEWMNKQQSFIAAVDIPSGVASNTGIVENIAVRADLTVTMGLAKIGHYVGAGREHAGDVRVVDISIPRFLFVPGRNPVFRVLSEDVTAILPKRSLTAHKYSVGKVFVLAGSRGLTGAPFMTAQSAMKAGAGAVVMGVPRSVYQPLVRKLTEVMVTPLDDTDTGSIAASALDDIRTKIEWADVVAIGPGLSQHEETQHVIRVLIESIPKPLVVDADGLNAIGRDHRVLRKRSFPTILTPHVGELHRLTGGDSKAIDQLRVEVAPRAAKEMKSVVILKGAPTITGTPNGNAYVNTTGNPAMATAGAGDVLTGITASLLAQGLGAEQAAYAAVFVHGMAGDIAAAKFGGKSVMALDILDQLPAVLKHLAQ